MKKALAGLAIGAAVLRGALIAASIDGASVPEGLRRLQQDDLRYEGAFRLPDGNVGRSTFAYGGTALAFNDTRRSLFVVGQEQHQLVAEVGIPEVRNAGSVRELAVAPVIQKFGDPLGGRLGTVHPGGIVKIGGLLVYDDRLYVSAYEYYDAPNTQIVSHFVADLDLSRGTDARGPYQVGRSGFCGTTNGNCAGFVDGYFGVVPSEWREAFGGPVVAGQCCVPIIGRTSYGPALFAIDPARLGAVNPLPAAPLVYYPQSNPLAGWDTPNQYFNGATEVKGVVFPSGTRSVLFFGRHGLGTFCYGEGSNDSELAKPPIATTGLCYDPTSPYKGTHAYPYAYYVWAYDAEDLASVNAHRRQPWTIKPYAVWKLELPFDTARRQISGAAFDPESSRIFLSQAFGEGELPVIHAFHVRTP